jgi:hypothetical protein
MKGEVNTAGGIKNLDLSSGFFTEGRRKQTYSFAFLSASMPHQIKELSSHQDNQLVKISSRLRKI